MLLNGEFKKVAVKANGAGVRNASELKKAFLHVHEGRVYLLTHIQSIDEGAGVEHGVPMHGMRCATYIAAAIFETFDELRIARAHGVSIEIFHDAASIAAVHGSAARNRAAGASHHEATSAAAEIPAAAAAVDAEPYTLAGYTRNMYEGFARYHASHGVAMNTPVNAYRGHRIGVELETEFATDSARAQFTDTPRNWYFCEADGSLDNAGCEIITIPLLPEDAKNRATWKPICDRLKQLGATSWDNNRCGLHVHIGREILGNTAAEREATLSRLLLFYNLYLNDDTTSNKVFGRTRCYNEHMHNDNQEFAAVKTLGAQVLKIKDIADRVGKAVKDRNNTRRYYTINTTNEHTIEFRKGRGSLSVDRIQTIITFCEAVCLYCRTTDDVSELTLDGFRDFIRATVPTSNALYHYYDVIERDC